MRKAILFFTLFALFCFLLLVIDAFWFGNEADLPVLHTTVLNKAEVMTPDEKKVFKSSEYFYNEFLKQTRFNGSILVAKNGKIAWMKSQYFRAYECYGC
jgi:hypothetical protein